MPEPSSFSPIMVSDCVTVDPYTASVRKKLEKAKSEIEKPEKQEIQAITEDEETSHKPTILQEDNEPSVVKNQDKLIDSF